MDATAAGGRNGMASTSVAKQEPPTIGELPPAESYSKAWPEQCCRFLPALLATLPILSVVP